VGAGGGGMLVDEMRRGRNGREASREQGAGSREQKRCHLHWRQAGCRHLCVFGITGSPS
jgi:hypothetical protein